MSEYCETAAMLLLLSTLEMNVQSNTSAQRHHVNPPAPDDPRSGVPLGCEVGAAPCWPPPRAQARWRRPPQRYAPQPALAQRACQHRPQQSALPLEARGLQFGERAVWPHTAVIAHVGCWHHACGVQSGGVRGCRCTPRELPRVGGGRILELLETMEPWQSMVVVVLAGGVRWLLPKSKRRGPGGNWMKRVLRGDVLTMAISSFTSEMM